jgi:hypothetical protein
MLSVFLVRHGSRLLECVHVLTLALATSSFRRNLTMLFVFLECVRVLALASAASSSQRIVMILFILLIQHGSRLLG